VLESCKVREMEPSSSRFRIIVQVTGDKPFAFFSYRLHYCFHNSLLVLFAIGIAKMHSLSLNENKASCAKNINRGDTTSIITEHTVPT
jgi:D-alanyl-lipoteichoic acid acyltransferase DltB (MBOAT superfamily)